MDDDFLISASSSSSQFISTPTLQLSLQLLLQGQQQWWNYAILWQTCANNETLCLTWAEGHFQGLKDPLDRPNEKPINDVAQEGSTMDDVVSDVEWYYMSSPPRRHLIKQGGILAMSFTTGALIWLTGTHSLRGYTCMRVQEARAHGLQTLVCIPVLNGVIELGSLDLNEENWALIQQTHFLFGPSGQSNVGPIRHSSSDGSNHPPQASPELVISNNGDPSEPCDSDGPISEERVPNERVPKKKGKRLGAQPQVVKHVAERQRRAKINSRFCALRSVVPFVSKMDKASILEDAVSYINNLTSKIDKLESKLKVMKEGGNNNNNSSNESEMIRVASATSLFNVTTVANIPRQFDIPKNGNTDSKWDLEVQVQLIASEAMIMVRCENVNHPCARTMEVLKRLDLKVHHVSVSAMGELMLQDIVIAWVPEEMRNEDGLKTAIIQGLERNKCVQLNRHLIGLNDT